MAVIEGPKHAECVHLQISMDSMQYNAGHCGLNDDTDDEHSV